VNRLWQHGMHEERVFHDRLNYFTAMQVGLLGMFAILYQMGPAAGVFVPLTAALVFTLLWLLVQDRHWRYCAHVNEQIRTAVPECGRTVTGWTDGFTITRWRSPSRSRSRPPGWRCPPGSSPRPGVTPTEVAPAGTVRPSQRPTRTGAGPGGRSIRPCCCPEPPADSFAPACRS
jgi:hypothetical protein